jgi:two-component system response regulator AlgR
MKVLVVDDEPLARERLRALLIELGVGALVSEAQDGAQALAQVARDPPEVVLLDIRMPGMSGLEVARHLAALPESPAVVFTSAYDEHALAAFDAQAVDYLLKPVRRERLRLALEHACRPPTRAQLDALAAGTARTHLSARVHGTLRLLPVAEVRCLLASEKYVTAVLPEADVLLDESLKALEAEFGPRFVRVHRNALVALAHVQALEGAGLGRCRVRLAGVAAAPEVSRRLLPWVRARLKAVR